MTIGTSMPIQEAIGAAVDLAWTIEKLQFALDAARDDRSLPTLEWLAEKERSWREQMNSVALNNVCELPEKTNRLASALEQEAVWRALRQANPHAVRIGDKDYHCVCEAVESIGRWLYGRAFCLTVDGELAGRFLKGELSQFPPANRDDIAAKWPTVGKSLLEYFSTFDGVSFSDLQVQVSKEGERSSSVGTTGQTQPMTDEQKRVFDYIVEKAPVSGKEIANKFGISESTVTSRYIPELKKHGVKNKRGAGYYT